MKVNVIEEHSDDGMYSSLEITIDDTYNFSVHHDLDSPEDNNLGRNFSDCFDIPSMLKKAYQAGKHGEDLDILFTEVDGDEGL